MLFAVIISFNILGSSGDAVTEERFDTMIACEAARPGIVSALLAEMEENHTSMGKITSRCGLSLEVGATEI